MVTRIVFGLALGLSVAAAARSPTEPKLLAIAWSKDGMSIAVRHEYQVTYGHDEGVHGPATTRDVNLISVEIYSCESGKHERTFRVKSDGRQSKKDRAAGWKKAEKWLQSEGYRFVAGKKAKKVKLPMGHARDFPAALVYPLPKRLFEAYVPRAQLLLTEENGAPMLAILVHREGSPDDAYIPIVELDGFSFSVTSSSCEAVWSPKATCLALLCVLDGPMVTRITSVYLVPGEVLRAAIE